MIAHNEELGIPLKFVGPLKINFQNTTFEVDVPLATFEAPLWPSVARGARVTGLAGGINVVVVHECMTRSILLEAASAAKAAAIVAKLEGCRVELEAEAKKTSRFVQLDDWSTQIVGNLIFVRFVFQTGDAAGHNMTTKAAQALQTYLLAKFSELKYVSISGNYCTDKKVSAVNGILGRGKYVVADVVIPREICTKRLHATPETIVDLNIKKNLIGSIIAGGVRTANAHFANMLLAFYLATGQDAANIIEGSQGITQAAIANAGLYFSVTLPNIIVGAVGSGKNSEIILANLKRLGCLDEREPGANSRRLAAIAAAAVLCGELSLLAAQTNQGELMRGHLKIERKK